MIPIRPFLFIPFGVAAAVGVLAGSSPRARGDELLFDRHHSLRLRLCRTGGSRPAWRDHAVLLPPSYINMFPNAFALGWLAMVVLLPAIWELSRPVP